MENYFSASKPTTTLPPSPSSHPPHTHRPSTIHTVQQNTARSSNSPLKLLIFHSQQLGLILQTATSQPKVITGFFSIVSSGSTGFSLSSLISIECLNHSWSIQQQVWMSLLAPAIVGLVCLLIYLYQQYREGYTASFGLSYPPTISSNTNPSHDRDTIQLGPSDSSSSDSSSITLTIPNESIVYSNHDHEYGILTNFPRMYGVCLALLYFFLFPCAQTVLSALACTDTRQYDSSSSDPTSSLYLNLLPWIACDSTWRSRTLPPAIVGVILWIITFPIVTTMFTRYLIVRIRVSKDIQLWPLCADLFTRFKPQYWYYEQILLARRLSLVLAITIIPSDSLYLPVTLFSIIQLSALIQHLMCMKAYQVLGESTKYLLVAQELGEVVWKRGLLKKGLGLCHGIAGNGYIFLKLYESTHQSKYLERACQFATFALTSSHASALADQPDVPSSLGNGRSAFVCFAMDLLNKLCEQREHTHGTIPECMVE